MTDQERIDYLIGQVTALKSFCFALMASHENLPLLASRMDRFNEQQVGILLGQAAEESTLDGADAMRTDLRNCAQDLLNLLGKRQASVDGAARIKERRSSEGRWHDPSQEEER